MKKLFESIKSFLKRIKGWWRIVYAGFALLVYIHFLGILGAIVMTIALIVLDVQIHKLD
jgi:hypothetical protein